MHRELRDVFKVQDEIARDVAQALSVKLDAVTLNRAQGGTTNIDAYDRYLRWRQLYLADTWDAEHDRQRVQLAREAVALDPKFVLAWDALAISLSDLADEVDGVQAAQLRAEVEQIRARIAQLAPDHWSVKRERAYSLWREGKRAEAIAVAREIMDSGPLDLRTRLSVHQPDLRRGSSRRNRGTGRAIEGDANRWRCSFPAIFNGDYIAARRYDEAEAEYRRSLALEGNHVDPTLGRLPAHAGAQGRRPQGATRTASPTGARLRRQRFAVSSATSAPCCTTATPCSPSCARPPQIPPTAATTSSGSWPTRWVKRTWRRPRCANPWKAGKASRKATWLPETIGRCGLAPYSGLRGHPEFKKLLIETGLAEYWRQTGKWGDGCKPVGADDFQCQ